MLTKISLLVRIIDHLLTLPEKCPNTELFLVRIFPHCCLHFSILSHFKIIRCIVKSLIATSTYFLLKHNWKKNLKSVFGRQSLGAETGIPFFQTARMRHCQLVTFKDLKFYIHIFSIFDGICFGWIFPFLFSALFSFNDKCTLKNLELSMHAPNLRNTPPDFDNNVMAL